MQERYEASLNERYERDERGFRGVRDIILKARQHGFSTYWLAQLFRKACNHSGVVAPIINKRGEDSELMFERIKRMYYNLPENRRPPIHRSNKREIRFQHDSHLIVKTAGEDELGRSATFSDVLATEFAFWPEDAFVSLLSAIPRKANLVIETTANGAQGQFYDLYWAAKRGDISFRPLFFPWFENPEYRLPNCNLVPDEEEKMLKERFGLDNGQLLWRRRQREIYKAVGKLDYFEQEMPATEEEAFVVTGQSRFPSEMIKKLRRDSEMRPEPETAPDGLKVYVKPIPGHRYLIAADPAEGVTAGGRNRDFHAAVILDRDCDDVRDQVAAEYMGRDIEPAHFAELLMKWGYTFNRAMLVVEFNNTGVTVCGRIREKSYPNVFRSFYYDWERGKTVNHSGIRVTPGNKTEMVDTLVFSMLMGTFWPVSKEIMRQMSVYGYDKRGRLRARSGHDDLVSCCYLATHAMHKSVMEYKDEDEIEYEFSDSAPMYA